MSLAIGDVVKYTANYHPVDEQMRGRICDRFGATYYWVNFRRIGCVLVKETSLERASGDAPKCTGCP